MSDESRRIGLITGGNANLLTILGDLLSSDGQQAMRLPLGLPGEVLTVNLAAECGLAWSPVATDLVAWAWVNTADGTFIESSGNLDIATVSEGIFDMSTNDGTEFTTCSVTGPLFVGAPSVPLIPMLPMAGITGVDSAQIRIVDRLGNPNATNGPFLVRFYR